MTAQRIVVAIVQGKTIRLDLTLFVTDWTAQYRWTNGSSFGRARADSDVWRAAVDLDRSDPLLVRAGSLWLVSANGAVNREFDAVTSDETGMHRWAIAEAKTRAGVLDSLSLERPGRASAAAARGPATDAGGEPEPGVSAAHYWAVETERRELERRERADERARLLGDWGRAPGTWSAAVWMDE